MQRINLIPTKKRLARQKRMRIRHWIIAVVAYSVVIVLGCFIYRGMTHSRNLMALTTKLNALDAEYADLQRQQETLRPKLQEQKLILAASRSITDQPDWSLLLNYLADDVLGDNIVLTSCSLMPAEGAVEVQAIKDSPLTLTLSGYARTAPDVSQFVLRLEKMSLFNKVTLTKTNREPFLNGQAIAFEARCLMRPDGEKTHE